MAANVAVENNWAEVMGRRAAGELVNVISGNPSTGIVNYKVTTAMRIINNCDIPLRFSHLIRQPSWPSKFPYSEDSRIDKQDVWRKLQSDVYSIDILGADILQSIYETYNAGLEPTIFNVANYRWFGGAQTAEELLAGTQPQKHGEHGVRIVRNFDRAAEMLGYSIRLASMPNGIQTYYRGIHRADMNNGFIGSEFYWYEWYGKLIS